MKPLIYPKSCEINNMMKVKAEKTESFITELNKKVFHSYLYSVVSKQ